MSRLTNKHRLVAIEKGEMFYSSGQSCKKGHEDKKYTSNGICITCLRIDKIKYRQTDKAKLTQKRYNKTYEWTGKEKARLNLYGLTAEGYKEILNKQNNKCAICNKDLDLSKKTCIDHCHNTKKVRGILCWGCNVGIGHFKDNPSILRSAVLYCEEFESLIVKGCQEHVSINT